MEKRLNICISGQALALWLVLFAAVCGLIKPTSAGILISILSWWLHRVLSLKVRLQASVCHSSKKSPTSNSDPMS